MSHGKLASVLAYLHIIDEPVILVTLILEVFKLYGIVISPAVLIFKQLVLTDVPIE
jgi:hypothetical protein